MSEEEVEELFKSTIDTGNNEVDYRGESCPTQELWEWERGIWMRANV